MFPNARSCTDFSCWLSFAGSSSNMAKGSGKYRRWKFR
jgi:hypothetical protein